jgi:hypothetical protein
MNSLEKKEEEETFDAHLKTGKDDDSRTRQQRSSAAPAVEMF